MKMNIAKHYDKNQTAEFVADFGFSKFESLDLPGGEIHIILDCDITEEQAAKYFATHKYVTKIEMVSGYFMRP